MPAALAVDWEAVKALCVAVGMAEASRRLGITHDAIRQRCRREGWKDDPDVAYALDKGSAAHQPLTVPVSQPVTTTAQALAQAMREDAVHGRSAALRLSRRKLEHLCRKDDDELLQPELVTAAHQATKDAALAGGWAANQPIAKLAIHVTGSASVSPAEPAQPQALEAEWSDV
jgi:hypothetical protein